jgi:hypothetical protein
MLPSLQYACGRRIPAPYFSAAECRKKLSAMDAQKQQLTISLDRYRLHRQADRPQKLQQLRIYGRTMVSGKNYQCLLPIYPEIADGKRGKVSPLSFCRLVIYLIATVFAGLSREARRRSIADCAVMGICIL